VPGNARARWAPLLVMVASGFAGLGYQIVWTQQSASWLGHEAAAVLAVVAAFFGGMGVGVLALGSRIEASPRPVRWYAGCELVIALWSLFLIGAMPRSSAWLLKAMGAEPTPVWQWLVAFAGTFSLLFPATAAMGATLPAMERIAARLYVDGRGARSIDRSIAGLYAGNTFGALLGVLAAAFWLVPTHGLARTASVCVALNLLCAGVALAVFPGTAEAVLREPARNPLETSRPDSRAVLARLALTGLLGIGYEVVVVRVLSQVAEDTVYTFALLLAVYLLGTAIGAAAYRRYSLARGAPPGGRDELGDRLLGALAAACLAGTAVLWAAERSMALARRLFGGGATAAILAEAIPALLAFGAPTIVMGALFSHLARRANAAGVSFGRALGANTLGAAAAPLVFGVVLLPAIGPKLALVLVGVGYLALVERRSWTTPVTWVPAAAALALGFLAPPLAFIDIPPGGRVVSYENGIMASVSVVEDVDGVARLRIDNRQQEGSSATLRVDGRQAWLPLLLHSAPRRALFLGLGTGMTASAAAEDPALEVDAVELLPEVVRASAYFTRQFPGSRLHVLAADARRYLRATDRRYDVIVSDNFHPARSGSGSLYTVEHFGSVRARLEQGGVFCQWVPLHQLDLDTLRSIVRSFTAVYPQAWAMIASNSLETPVLGLVGRRDAGRFASDVVRARLARVAPAARLDRLGLEDELAVLGSFVAGPEALRRFAGDAPINSDDRPVVAYLAPRITYAPDSRPGDRLVALLRVLALRPDELIFPGPDPTWARRLGAYWVARDRFVESGREVRPSSNVRDMLAQVREPLLSVLRLSPDFRPAYDPLLSMASALAPSDPLGARTLLLELAQIQPARAEAVEALALLEAPGRAPPDAAPP